jgi:transcriptional regulator with XRE-family HTH domain
MVVSILANQSVSAVDKELAESIGAASRVTRHALKLTQEDAAERIGVSAEFYARIERGNALPSVPTLARLCSALGISADTLLGRADPDRAEPGRAEPGRIKEVAPRWTPPSPPDGPELRRVLRRLRKASPATLRVVTLLVKELERRP